MPDFPAPGPTGGLKDDAAEARRRIVTALLPHTQDVEMILDLAVWIETGELPEEATDA